MTRTLGLVLAAGAGTRMGRPKALVHDADGRPWVAIAVDTLLAGGCDEVVVVLGAAAREARALVPDRPAVRSVVATDWVRGAAASLRTGLAAALQDDRADAVLVSLVDLPGLPTSAVRRVLGSGSVRPALRRAVHDGRPGHPVLVGRDHWPALATALASTTSESADRGAGLWLRTVGVDAVECGDVWDGRDVDVLGPALRRAARPRIGSAQRA